MQFVQKLPLRYFLVKSLLCGVVFDGCVVRFCGVRMRKDVSLLLLLFFILGSRIYVYHYGAGTKLERIIGPDGTAWSYKTRPGVSTFVSKYHFLDHVSM